MDSYVRKKIITYNNDMVGVHTRRLSAVHKRDCENVEKREGRRSLRLEVEVAAAATQYSSVCETGMWTVPRSPV